MNIEVKPGKYVVAVSGGVDSVVLLDLLRTHPGLELIVGHFDHGIRIDSAEDAKFVETLAKQASLPFRLGQAKLGPRASEAMARDARYNYLRQIMYDENADGIITAHHQDDVLETAVINLIRGTGRSGMASLRSTDGIIRPLLKESKSNIHKHAATRKLRWREDSTNLDTTYLRNHVRLHVLPRLGKDGRAQLLQLIESTGEVNVELNALLEQLLGGQDPRMLSRHAFIMLPHTLARETLAAWLRQNGIREFDRPAIERMTVRLKVLPHGKRIDISKGYYIIIGKNLALKHPER